LTKNITDNIEDERLKKFDNRRLNKKYEDDFYNNIDKIADLEKELAYSKKGIRRNYEAKRRLKVG